MRYSGKQGLPLRAIFFNLLPAIAWGVLTVFFLFYVFRYVDLRPRVDENFFFSSNGPQAQTDKLISKFFLQTPELILSAKGDIRSPDYLRKIRELSTNSQRFPG